jgi:hypothetical protein
MTMAQMTGQERFKTSFSYTLQAALLSNAVNDVFNSGGFWGRR